MAKVKILLLSLLVILAGSVAGLQVAGVIDIGQFSKELPVVGKLLPGDSPAGVKSPLELENERLQAKISQLEQELMKIETDKTALADKNNQLEKKMIDLEIAEKKRVEQQDKAVQLADYYAEMKPAAAVAIMEQLDQELVAQILQQIDADQAAKILSAMEPAKAAEIIKLISR